MQPAPAADGRSLRFSLSGSISEGIISKPTQRCPGQGTVTMGKLQEILVAGQALLNLPGSQQQAGTRGLAGLEGVQHKP